MDSLKAGDNRAFKQLYRQGYHLIEALIVKNKGLPEDAEDVFQEVLFVVIKKLRQPGFEISCALNTYLYAIARNIWRNRLRSKKLNVEFKDTLPDFVDPTESSLAIKNLFEKRHTVVRQLLEDLSDKCRQILIGFYYEKKSMQQIGKQLSLVEASVRVQKHRCMNYLKNKVEAHPGYRDLLNE